MGRAERIEFPHNVMRDVADIKGAGAVLRDGLQSVGEFRVAVQIAGVRGFAVGEIKRGRVRVRLHPRRFVFPIARDAGGDGDSGSRRGDGGGEQFFPRDFAESLVQLFPGGDRAGDGDGQGGSFPDSGVALRKRKPGGEPSGSVQRDGGFGSACSFCGIPPARRRRRRCRSYAVRRRTTLRRRRWPRRRRCRCFLKPTALRRPPADAKSRRPHAPPEPERAPARKTTFPIRRRTTSLRQKDFRLRMKSKPRKPKQPRGLRRLIPVRPPNPPTPLCVRLANPVVRGV